MMGGSSSTTIIENSALASTATKAANVAACQGNSKKTGSKGKISCDHCNKQWHTRDTCWKLHGKPQNWKNNGRFHESS